MQSETQPPPGDTHRAVLPDEVPTGVTVVEAEGRLVVARGRGRVLGDSSFGNRLRRRHSAENVVNATEL